jgi:hypothetical protein
VLAASILCTGLNPFGYALLLFPFKPIALLASGVAEWSATNLRELWPFRVYLLFIIFLLTFRRTVTTWTDRLFLLFFINASLLFYRNVSLACIFLSPFIATSVDACARTFRQSDRSRVNGKQLRLSRASGPVLMALTASGLVIALAGSGGLSKAVSGLFPLPDIYSPDAVRYLEEHRPPGNLFSDDSWGDYLLYMTDLKVFIDGRFDMYGEDIFRDYRKIANAGDAVEELLSKYRIDWVLFSPEAVLTRYLKMTGAWKEVYRDGQVSILVRSVSPDG